jgi:REP element-mobilizing transposase RayT
MKKRNSKFPKSPSEFGGIYDSTRDCRKKPRPLSYRCSMHFVLRSSQAIGRKSFRNFRKPIDDILNKFAAKHRVKIVRYANSNNHLHLQLALQTRHSYKAFIRAVSAAIAMKVAGKSRWNKVAKKFWDRRPWSRIVEGRYYATNMRRYIWINQLEGCGYSKAEARTKVRLLYQSAMRLLESKS